MLTHSPSTRGSGPALRTAFLLRERFGRVAVGNLYHAFGMRVWESELPAEVDDLDGIRASLKEMGADPLLLDEALADPGTWEAVVQEHQALVDRTGAFGVPTIVLDGGDGPAIFGPVVYKLPTDEDAVALWRHTTWLVRYGNFAELKRGPRRPARSAGDGVPRRVGTPRASADPARVAPRWERVAPGAGVDDCICSPGGKFSDAGSENSDAFEELRRARGEGWQWHRIQMEACPQCGDHPAGLPAPSLGPLAVERAAQWREFLEQTDVGYLRHIPEPGVFSPLQYAAHVHDILRVYTDRIVLGLEHDAPTVPIFQPPQEAWKAYNRSDVPRAGLGHRSASPAAGGDRRTDGRRGVGAHRGERSGRVRRLHVQPRGSGVQRGP